MAGEKTKKPFSYYRRLPRSEQAVYRKSDQLGRIVVPDPSALAAPIRILRAALTDMPGTAAQRLLVKRAVEDILDRLCRGLSVPPVAVRVLARRPSGSGGELYALYTLPAGGRPYIDIWLQTARRGEIVAFRTFFRTLVHEFCHHLDYHLLGLENSYHTRGFFQRESSLVQQLLRASPPAEAPPPPAPSAAPPPTAAQKPPPERKKMPRRPGGPRQLTFDF